MTKLKGTIQVPESMLQILNTISEQRKSKEGCLVRFQYLIEPIIAATFYGLYKSQELPPLEKETNYFDKSYEFNVDITNYAEKLNHFLFCLWVKLNGMPDESENIKIYRKDLYEFISKLLDDDYFQNIIIPFYLKKADERSDDASSFIYRLWNSDNIGLTMQDYSPEFLAKEFCSVQNEYIEDVVLPIMNKEMKK
jgi:hypothetical protein